MHKRVDEDMEPVHWSELNNSEHLLEGNINDTRDRIS